TQVLTFFFSSRRRHTRFSRDWSSDVCSSDLGVHHQTGNREADIDNAPDQGIYPATVEGGHQCQDRPEPHPDQAREHADLERQWRSEERRVGKERTPAWSSVTREHKCVSVVAT